MSKADCLALVTLLSNGEADSTLASAFYDEEVAFLSDWHTVATPVTFTANSTQITFDPNMLNLIQLIYDNDVLSNLGLREIESIKAGWRNYYGRPVAFTLQSELTKTAEVFPVPQLTSPPIVPVHGLPVGQDFAPGNGIAIYSHQVTDILPYLNLPIALKILEHEYSRESAHMNPDFAQAAGSLGKALLEALVKDGVIRTGN